MPIETVTYISDLNPANPVGSTDKVQTLDDHVRNIKTALLNTLPNVTGAITASQTEINRLVGVSFDLTDAARKSTDNTFSHSGTHTQSFETTDASDARLRFVTNSAVRGFFGAPGLTNGLITGATVNDMIWRIQSGRALISGDGGTTIHASFGASGATLNGVAASDFARLSQANAFTGYPQTITTPDSEYAFVINGASTALRFVPTASAFQVWARTPSNSGYEDLQLVATTIALEPQSGGLAGVTVAGVAASDFARLSQSNTFTSNHQNISASGVADSYLAISADSSVAFFGVSDTTSALITGDNAGMAIMRGSVGVGFSGNSGTTMHFKLSSDGTVVTPNAHAFEVGYKGTPLDQHGADYTLVLNDCGKLIQMTGGTTLTVPAEATVVHPYGTQIVIENATGGNISIASAGGVTVYLAGTAYGTTGTRTLARGGVCTLMKRSANAWLISGPGLS